MIRVLHSVSNMDRAGVETMIMNYYRHMDRSQIQFDFWANKPKPGAYEAEITEMGGHVYRSTGYNPLHFLRYVRAMKRVLEQNPDIRLIHVHNGALGLYALVAARLCGMRVRLYHAHSTVIPPGKVAIVKKLLKPFIRFEATHLLTCGEKAARFYYGSRNVDRGKCIYVHNAIEPDRFVFNQEIRDKMRAVHDLSGHTVIGHVGRMAAAKNHLRMLEMFAALKRVKLDAVLVLLGDGELEAQVKAYAEQLGLLNDVRFMGNVSNVGEWMQAFDLFLMPSIFEGMPVVAVEAQAAGLPCVLSDVITREADVTGLVRFISLELGDEEWAQAIIAALTEQKERPDTLAAIQNAGYDINQAAPRLQGLYQQYAKEYRKGE